MSLAFEPEEDLSCCEREDSSYKRHPVRLILWWVHATGLGLSCEGRCHSAWRPVIGFWGLEHEAGKYLGHQTAQAVLPKDDLFQLTVTITFPLKGQEVERFTFDKLYI